jgi:hypothetical protein
VVCTRPQGDNIPALQWPLRMAAARVEWITLPPTEITANTKMEMAVGVVDADYNTLYGDDNTTTCTATTSVLTQRGDETAAGGVVAFGSFQILGRTGSTYVVTVACKFGDIPFPNVITASVTIAGCRAGEEPLPDGTSCQRCGDNSYSDGGTARCEKCPYGVACADGLLTVQENFFLAVTPAMRANPTAYNLTVLPDGRIRALITQTTEFHQCWAPDACIVNATERSFGCSPGYGGVLCGVCQLDAGYVKSTARCVPCAPPAVDMAILTLAILAILGILTYISIFMDFGNPSAAKTVWRILVNYISGAATALGGGGRWAGGGGRVRRGESYPPPLPPPSPPPQRWAPSASTWPRARRRSCPPSTSSSQWRCPGPAPGWRCRPSSASSSWASTPASPPP